MVGRKELGLVDDWPNGDWVWMDLAGYWGPKSFGWVLGSKRFGCCGLGIGWFGYCGLA